MNLDWPFPLVGAIALPAFDLEPLIRLDSRLCLGLLVSFLVGLALPRSEVRIERCCPVNDPFGDNVRGEDGSRWLSDRRLDFKPVRPPGADARFRWKLLTESLLSLRLSGITKGATSGTLVGLFGLDWVVLVGDCAEFLRSIFICPTA